MDPAYYEKILTGHHSQPLKERVAKCISSNRDFEDTENPGICYIAAWHEKDRIIWYEFASRRLRELLGCESSQVAEVFRNSVVERRIYKYRLESDRGIYSESLRSGLQPRPLPPLHRKTLPRLYYKQKQQK